MACTENSLPLVNILIVRKLDNLISKKVLGTEEEEREWLVDFVNSRINENLNKKDDLDGMIFLQVVWNWYAAR